MDFLSDPPAKLTADEHFSQLCDLLILREAMTFERDAFRGDLAALNDRLAFHRAKLQVDIDDNIPLVEAALNSDKSARILGAVHFLLHSRHDKAADLVIKLLLETQRAESLGAISNALVSSPIDELPLELLLDMASPEVASVILLAFAAHGRADAYDRERVKELLESASPEVRARGWQIVSFVGA